MDELNNKVKDWICTQGYPVEMQVAKLFRGRGFRTTQSEYYVDHESGDSREIDVTASKQMMIGEILVRVQVCVECKSTKKHPWVVFTSNDTWLASPATIVQRSASKIGENFLRSVCQSKKAQSIPIFRMNQRNGYSLTEAFTTGKDNSYSSCISVAKCARALVREADLASEQQGPVSLIVLPLVLIDGKLFECHQDSTDMEVSEISRVQLIWRNDIANTGHSIINICQIDALHSFIDDLECLVSYTFEQVGHISKTLEESLNESGARWRKSL